MPENPVSGWRVQTAGKLKKTAELLLTLHWLLLLGLLATSFPFSVPSVDDHSILASKGFTVRSDCRKYDTLEDRLQLNLIRPR